MARLTRCGNCNELPTIKEQRGYYRFRLDHYCCPTFSLESHQHTADACRRDWNRYNANNFGLRTHDR